MGSLHFLLFLLLVFPSPTSSQILPSSHLHSPCHSSYGVLPCTTSLVGNLFLLAVYGFLLYIAATMLSEGSELLLIALDPGLFGGLLLPLLGVLPDAILVAVSGLGGSRDEAQGRVIVGIGLLAGSNVLLLTVLWGTCLIVGRCDFHHYPFGEIDTLDKTLTKGFDLFGTGAVTDNVTRASARIMSLSVVPFLIAELSMKFHTSAARNGLVLAASVVSLCGLLAYCIYQARRPEIQEYRRKWAAKRLWKAYILENFFKLHQSLVSTEGNIDPVAVKGIFENIDVDNSGSLSTNEIKAALVVLQLNNRLPDGVVDNFMKDFDRNQDKHISLDEFEDGLKKWCRGVTSKDSLQEYICRLQGIIRGFEEITEEEKEECQPMTRRKFIWKAICLLIGGAIIATCFADPLVDALTGFSKASHIPSFFLSFVLLPLASNASESVSSIIFASRKRKSNLSMAYSQIYGGVTMNNTVCLGVFLAIVYGRHLVWEFTSEVLVIALITIIMGSITSVRKILPLWLSLLAVFLYPLSLGLVAVLDYVVGWE